MWCYYNTGTILTSNNWPFSRRFSVESQFIGTSSSSDRSSVSFKSGVDKAMCGKCGMITNIPINSKIKY